VTENGDLHAFILRMTMFVSYGGCVSRSVRARASIFILAIQKSKNTVQEAILEIACGTVFFQARDITNAR
jgi:hypothetical protein